MAAGEFASLPLEVLDETREVTGTNRTGTKTQGMRFSVYQMMKQGFDVGLEMSGNQY